jgi:hypothetical protein
MILMMTPGTMEVHITQSPTSRVLKLDANAWHLEIPARTRAGYRLAQLDDHGSLRRSKFHWTPPLRMSLQARVSAQTLPGTWGFGLWNDPFSFLIAYGGVAPRLPVLPDAAWFFHASPENHLAIHDNLPANGFLSATFSSKKVPFILLALTSPVLALAFLPGAAQLARKLLRRWVNQDAAQVGTDVTEWHAYGLEWRDGQVRFSLDGATTFETAISPPAPLSLVIWIDNQFAAFPARDRLRYGTLPNAEPAWMEIRELHIDKDR